MFNPTKPVMPREVLESRRVVSIYTSLSLVLDHPQRGVHLLVVLLGLTTTPCIVVASVIAYRMYNLPLSQSRVPSRRSCRSSPLGSTSRPNSIEQHAIRLMKSVSMCEREMTICLSVFTPLCTEYYWDARASRVT